MSYSSVLRDLRQTDNEEAVYDFLSVYKAVFDKLITSGKKDSADKALDFTLKFLVEKHGAKIPGKMNKTQGPITINRFAKVEDDLYRGGAPSPNDIKKLQDLGIKRIVSLDLPTATQIGNACKQAKIEHIVLPIQASNYKTIEKLPKIDWATLLFDGGPCFVHCLHGKDRTGLAIALLRCQQGVPCKKAIAEADTFGFCAGLPTAVRDFYCKLLADTCQHPGDHAKADDNAAFDLPLPDFVADYKFNPDYYNPMETDLSIHTQETELPMGKRTIETEDLEDKIMDKESPEYKIKHKENAPQVGLMDNSTTNNLPLGPINVGTQYGTGYIAMASKNMFKRSYHIQMTYDISDTEIMYAEEAIQAFTYLLKGIERFNSHLDKLAVPFKTNQEVPAEQVWDARSTFRDYRDNAQNYLDIIKKLAFACVKIMNNFMSDTQVEKIMKSFNMSIDDVTKQFGRFKRLFKNLQAEDFIANCVKAIDAIKKEVAQLNQIIEERIQKYIETDILAKSWMDNAGDLDLELEDKVPFDQELLEAQKDKV